MKDLAPLVLFSSIVSMDTGGEHKTSLTEGSSSHDNRDGESVIHRESGEGSSRDEEGVVQEKKGEPSTWKAEEKSKLLRYNDQFDQSLLQNFVAELSKLTEDQADYRQNIMVPATVAVDDGGELSVDVHRKSWIIPLQDIQYRRSLRKYVNNIVEKAKAFIKEKAGVDVTPTMVRTDHGNQIDGSVVLYEEGDYFRIHQDAAGSRYPERSWTFLLYLMCPDTGGNTVFPYAEEQREVRCNPGSFSVWRNYDSSTNTTHDAAMHSAEGVGPREPVKMYVSTFNKGKTPVNINKIAMNIWFNEKGTPAKKKKQKLK